MPKIVPAVLWPTEENYAAFVDICDDPIAPTLGEFRANVAHAMARRGFTEIIRVEFEPAKLRDWCRSHGSPVNAEARVRYATIMGAALHERKERNASNGSLVQ